ncbi:MAG TPA: hypothetical protein VF779_02735 [Pyrinomonadaceae bacterium]
MKGKKKRNPLFFHRCRLHPSSLLFHASIAQHFVQYSDAQGVRVRRLENTAARLSV